MRTSGRRPIPSMTAGSGATPLRIGLLLLATLTLLAVSIATPIAAAVVTVSQQGRAFTVASLQVLKCQVVHFSNDDRFMHQIYVETAAFTFESEEQKPGTGVDVPFSKTGLFDVRCHIHPKMLVQVEVR